MASSGYFENSYRGWTYRVQWVQTPNVEGNYSTIKCTHFLYCSPSYALRIYGSRTHSCTINGTKVTFTYSDLVTDGDETIQLGTTTHTVKHNDDGTGSFTLSAVFSFQATLSGVYVESITISNKSATLDTIARKSTLSVSDGTLATKQIITISRQSSSFRHELKYTCGSVSAYLLTKSSSATSIEWTPDIGLASQAASGNTVKATLTLTTFASASSTTVIGTDTKTITLTIPQSSSTSPTVSIATAPVNTNIPSKFSSLYIQSKSKVKVTLTETPKNGATIKSRKIVIDGNSYTTNPATSGYLLYSGARTISATVTDSRDFPGTSSTTINVLAYSKPFVAPHSSTKSITCARSASNGTLWDEGQYIKVKCSKSYTKLYSGSTLLNKCVLQYRIKKSSEADTAYTNWTTLLAASSSSDDYDNVIPSLTIEKETGYTVQLRVTDDIGETSTLTYNIGTAAVTIHLPQGGEGVGVGMYSSGSGVEVGYDAHFYGDVTGNVLGLSGLPQIPENANLNEYRQFGAYSIKSNAVAETLSNIPYKKAGTLRVFSGTGTSSTEGAWVYIIQEYIDHTGRFRYSRNILTNGTVGQWQYGDWQFSGACATAYVVASGTKADTNDGSKWYYKKWSDGTYEAWTIFSVTIPGSFASAQPLYYSNEISKTLPFTVTSGCAVGSTAGLAWLTNTTIQNNNSVVFRVMSTSYMEETTLGVRLHVTGTYE